MTVEPGTRLGPYEIVSALGAGGMGEVFRARDTRLDREVAIKVLPAGLAETPELRERLEREARAISSLNHPHICTLHDIGRENGVDFLVLELLEGETLIARLTKGPLPVDDALGFASQIADALDRAHRHGIVHRDLKPGNVMLTADGAKLLDFGLAKLNSPADTADGLSALPTQEKALTQEGAILGTFQYMSPEQLEGKEADVASDVFAFGAVLFEMVTGRKAFEGESQASLIAAIMSNDAPRASDVRRASPPALDELIRSCLAKTPAERRQSAHDIRLELQKIRDGKTETPREASTLLPMALACLAGLVVGALLGAWAIGARSSDAPEIVRRVELPLENHVLIPRGRHAFALSPDGKALVFVSESLNVHRVDTGESFELPRTEGAVEPFFSPDGRRVGFYAEGEVRKISLDGGRPVTVCATTNFRGASWRRDGTIVFANEQGIVRVHEDGSGRELIVAVSGASWPSLIAEGTVLYSTPTEVVAHELGSDDAIPLVAGHDARYLPTGRLVFVDEGNLNAVPFDPGALGTLGGSRTVLEGVAQTQNGLGGEYSVSASGDLVYLEGSFLTPDELVWLDRTGRQSPLGVERGVYLVPRVSPDGAKLAVARRTMQDFRDIWVLDIGRDAFSRFTFDSAWDTQPHWSPDGGQLLFVSNREGERKVFQRASDGSGDVVLSPLPIEGDIQLSSWSRTGDRVALVKNTNSGLDIHLGIVTDDAFEVTPFLTTAFDETQPSLSPDGKYVAYASDETGRPEVYVQPVPGPGEKLQLSTDGGMAPLWSPVGDEIFYRRDDAMMTVAVTTEPSLSAGAPVELFRGAYRSANFGRNVREYDVTPDGQRFIMVAREGSGLGSTTLKLITSWLDEVERLVPVE